MKRSRLAYGLLVLVVIALGLGSRSGAAWLPGFVAAYAGDTLWAVTVFLLLGVAFPARPTWQVAAITWTLAMAVELSQLWHPPWLDAIRATLPGRLVLGQGFLASDLVCLSVGVALGALGELAFLQASGRGRRSEAPDSAHQTRGPSESV